MEALLCMRVVISKINYNSLKEILHKYEILKLMSQCLVDVKIL